MSTIAVPDGDPASKRDQPDREEPQQSRLVATTLASLKQLQTIDG